MHFVSVAVAVAVVLTGGGAVCAATEEVYGELLPGSCDLVSFWRVSSGLKVPRLHGAPVAKCRGIALRTAVNEAEAVQLVITPHRALSDVKVKLGALPKSKAGDELPVPAFDILRVGYVPVENPADGKVGAAELWPDPLPPQNRDVPLAVPAAANQPFWIRVKPPKGTPKGVYRSEIWVECTDAAGGYRFLKIPLAVEVFGFSMPDVYTCKAAFGRGPGAEVFRYHNAKRADAKVAVADGYYTVMAGDSHFSVIGARCFAPGEAGGLRSFVRLLSGFDPGEDRVPATAVFGGGAETAAGRHVPYYGVSVDCPGVEPRAWIWRLRQEGAVGISIRQSVSWNSGSVGSGVNRPRNPYLAAPRRSVSGNAGHGSGCAEGCLIYPPEECFRRNADGALAGELQSDKVVFAAPAVCIRLEMIREGIEDYEYFALLERLDPGNALLKVPEEVFVASGKYVKSPEPMENHRLKMAREIERLVKE